MNPLRTERHGSNLFIKRLPDAPVKLTSSSETANTVELDWEAVSQADGYKVYQDGSEIASPTMSNYSVTGLTTATNYSFYVTATNTSGESEKSNTISVTTT